MALAIVGWNEGDQLQWRHVRGDAITSLEVPVGERRRALEAFIDFVRDPRHVEEQRLLGELLQVRAWQHALETLDENLSKLTASSTSTGSQSGGRDAAARAESRLAFRVTVRKAATPQKEEVQTVQVEPLLQKRGRDGKFSRGARIPWHECLGTPTS